jgi:hypothetical protein
LHRDESKEELQSYYKLTDEDMEEITKEWPAEFLVPVEDVELSDPDIIGSPLVTQVEHDGQTSTKKKKKKEEVKNIETDEEDNASEESRPDSPAGGGGDEVNQEKKEGKKEKIKKKVKLHHRRIPLPRLKHRRKGRFLRRNPQQERRPMPISLSQECAHSGRCRSHHRSHGGCFRGYLAETWSKAGDTV